MCSKVFRTLSSLTVHIVVDVDVRAAKKEAESKTKKEVCGCSEVGHEGRLSEKRGGRG